MTTAVTLDPEQLRDLADLVADRVLARLSTDDQADPALVSAREIAQRFGLTRSWCYEHAGELGALRIGAGSRPRLRFNPEAVERYLAQLQQAPDPTPIAKPRRAKRAQADRTSAGAPLLEIKDAA